MNAIIQERSSQFEAIPRAKSVSGSRQLVELINANTSGAIGSCLYYHDDIVVNGAIGATAPVMITNISYDVCWVTISTASIAEEYGAELVKRVLEADARPPAASFSNVIDMLDWLDRE
jgi:hypothetical protein